MGQKGNPEIQRIRDAMEGNKPVVSDYMRELIVKQAGVIGERRNGHGGRH